MRVCRDATFGTKANREADVPNEEDAVGEARMLHSAGIGKVSALYAYIMWEVWEEGVGED